MSSPVCGWRSDGSLSIEGYASRYAPTHLEEVAGARGSDAWNSGSTAWSTEGLIRRPGSWACPEAPPHRTSVDALDDAGLEASERPHIANSIPRVRLARRLALGLVALQEARHEELLGQRR